MDPNDRYTVSRPHLSFAPDPAALPPVRGAITPSALPDALSKERCFQLHNLLSPAECAALVSGARPYMEPVDWEYVKEVG